MKKEQMKKVAEHIMEYNDPKVFLKQDYNENRADVKNGCYLIWYSDQRAFLKDLYNEAEEVADRFTDEQVFQQYQHVIALMSGKKKYFENI